MQKETIIVKNLSCFDLPEYKTKGASGVDVQADFCRTFGCNDSKVAHSNLNALSDHNPTQFNLKPGQIQLFKTGLFVDIPEGFEIQVRSRSGLSLKGVVCANSPGTIDSDYRGEVCVILSNISSHDLIINHGDRIAQLVLCPILQIH